MTERIQNVHPLEYDGISYRSTLEANTARVLTLLHIPFKYESRKITLLEGFKCPYEENKVRAITYTPDFEIPISHGTVMLECKGFETPEWKNKKKYLYKYLMEKEPDTKFFMLFNCKKDLLKALDNFLYDLGYCVEVTDKEGDSSVYSSVKEAVRKLSLEGIPYHGIINCFIDQAKTCGKHHWKLKRIEDTE